MPSLTLPDAMATHVLRQLPTGSRAICQPPPAGTDEDWIVLVSGAEPFHSAACADGWNAPVKPGDESKQYPDGFCSYRKGELNLIVTASPDFYDRFEAATQVARRLNVLKKADRVALFHAVLFAEKCEDPTR